MQKKHHDRWQSILGTRAMECLLEDKATLSKFEDIQSPAWISSIQTECTSKILSFSFLQKIAKCIVSLYESSKKSNSLYILFLSAPYLEK